MLIRGGLIELLEFDDITGAREVEAPIDKRLISADTTSKTGTVDCETDLLLDPGEWTILKFVLLIDGFNTLDVSDDRFSVRGAV
jgi:hypothetical protein